MASHGLTGTFRYLDDLVEALQTIREKGFRVEAVYSPVRSREILAALDMKPSPVRCFTLVGGILGIATGFALAIYTASQWLFVVGGKPPVPRVPYVIVGFECCILMGVFWNLISLWINSRLPRLSLPDGYDPRFSRDRFGVVVLCAGEAKQRVAELLTAAGAEEVHDAAR